MRSSIWLALVVWTCAAQPPAAQVQIPEPDAYRSLTTAGRAALRKGDSTAAIAALDEAWKLIDPGPRDDPRRYETMRMMYFAHLTAQHYDDAELWLTQAMDFRQRVDGADSLKLADDLTELAMLCTRRNDVDRAVTIMERVQSIHVREAKGYFGTLVADDFARIGNLELLRKKPEQAATAFTSALALRENVVGGDHPSLLPDLDRLGSTLIVLRDYPKAEDTFRRALGIRSRTVGPADLELLPTLEGIAYSCFGQKKYAEAEPFYKQVLAIWTTSGGEDHPMIALTEDKLTVFYREQEKWDEAKVHADHALALRAKFLASGYAREAGFLVSQKDMAGAAALYQKALTTIDPPRPEQEDFRKEVEANLKTVSEFLPQPAPKPAAAPKRKQATPAR